MPLYMCVPHTQGQFTKLLLNGSLLLQIPSYFQLHDGKDSLKPAQCNAKQCGIQGNMELTNAEKNFEASIFAMVTDTQIIIRMLHFLSFSPVTWCRKLKGGGDC